MKPSERPCARQPETREFEAVLTLGCSTPSLVRRDLLLGESSASTAATFGRSALRTRTYDLAQLLSRCVVEVSCVLDQIQW